MRVRVVRHERDERSLGQGRRRVGDKTGDSMQAVYKDGNDDEEPGSIHVEGQGPIGGRIGGESALAEEEEEYHYNNVIPFAFHCSQRSHQVVMTSSPPAAEQGKAPVARFVPVLFRASYFSLLSSSSSSSSSSSTSPSLLLLLQLHSHLSWSNINRGRRIPLSRHLRAAT